MSFAQAIPPPLATDSGTGSDANPIGGAWTAVGTSGIFAANQRLSNTIAATTLAPTRCDSYRNDIPTISPDQYAQATIAACGAGGNSCGAGVTLRAGAGAGYECYWYGVTGNSGLAAISKNVSGSNHVLLTVNWTAQLGDVITGFVINNQITLLINGNLVATSNDTDLTTGYPGVMLYATDAVANAEVTTFSCGNAQDVSTVSGNAGVAGATVAWSGTASGSTTADGSGNWSIDLPNGSYTITPSLAGYTFSPTSASETVSGSNITGVNFTATNTPVVWSEIDSRVSPYGPNASRTVQGTVTYDVQTSSNPNVPPVDSRAAGAPVDSRAAGQAPQNCRNTPSE